MVDICLVKALGKIGTELGHNTPNGWISDQISWWPSQAIYVLTSWKVSVLMVVGLVDNWGRSGTSWRCQSCFNAQLLALTLQPSCVRLIALPPSPKCSTQPQLRPQSEVTKKERFQLLALTLQPSCLVRLIALKCSTQPQLRNQSEAIKKLQGGKVSNYCTPSGATPTPTIKPMSNIIVTLFSLIYVTK